MKVRSLLLISIRFFNTVSIQTNQTISSTPLLLILLQTLLIFVGGKSYSCSRLDSLGWLQTVLNKNDQAPLRALSMLLPCTNSATTQNFGSVIARFHSNMEPSLTSELSFSDARKRLALSSCHKAFELSTSSTPLGLWPENGCKENQISSNQM